MGAMPSQFTSLTIVNSTVYSGRSKKTSKLRATGLCAWNSQVTGEFPAKMASNAENISSWWHHHAMLLLFREPITSPKIVYTSSPTCCACTNSIVFDLITMKDCFFSASATSNDSPSSVTRGQFWPLVIDVAHVSVCVCVCVNHELVRAITHQWSPVQARITKFGSDVQYTLVMILVVLGSDCLLPSKWKFNSKSKSIMSSCPLG